MSYSKSRPSKDYKGKYHTPQQYEGRSVVWYSTMVVADEKNKDARGLDASFARPSKSGNRFHFRRELTWMLARAKNAGIPKDSENGCNRDQTHNKRC